MSAPQSETHHSRILDDITRKIVDGIWKPGHRLDREVELAAQYNVSRMTVNKVLTQLAQEGYITRRKRLGTVVARPRAQSAVMAISNVGEEVAALGRSYRWARISRAAGVRAVADCRRLGLVGGGAAEGGLLFVRGLHYADAEPFCLEARAINLAVVPDATGMAFEAEVPGAWLVETMPWTDAHHQVRALNATGEEARRLGLVEGTACLEIRRKTRIGENWVTSVRLLYPGAAHQLVAEFEGHTGG
ncbi:MAG: GntR family transcriptional regulator [Tropicimonas sp.]|uniref:GntR family transcriptional regulator n=1 Tax=Tropicimonas sp. TaxID=2067044 RepID=UPI003A8B26B2